MTKIILISMIKNEERIIQRCIEHCLLICDGICITDTGSTDKTLEKIEEMKEILKTKLGDKMVPIKVYNDEWKDFGHNRSNSFNNTVKFCEELGWDKESTYGLLLDADMKLQVKHFNKDILKSNGYKIIQQNNSLEYYNTRFLKLSYPWKCVGVTHEYWDGYNTDTITKDIIYIDDIGDGGCKNDKFERDIKLLTKGLEEDPNNGRYMFYLAQTYKDTGKFKQAIKLYKKRIQVGGWYEEVWYSYYMISKCWLLLGDEEKFECWANKAYKYRKERLEPIYELVKHFRIKGEQIKAYHYYKIGKKISYPKNDSLFINKNMYEPHMLEYESTILYYYLFPDRIIGMKKSLEYLNNYTFNEHNVYDNIDHYMVRLLNHSEKIKLDLYNHQDYYATSSSMIKMPNNKILMNVRYVNYKIQPDGSYLMSKNGVLSREEKVRTKNKYIILNKDYDIESNYYEMLINDTGIIKKNTNILGLEDVRLFKLNDLYNNVKFIATSREYSVSDTNSMVIGNYDLDKNEMNNIKVIYSPNLNNCEKNWIPIDNKIIYKWHPLQIGQIDNNRLIIKNEFDTPSFFKHIRGSSNMVYHNNEYWCIVHGVKYYTPRKYYHMIVVLDNEYKLKRYSVPFYFNEYKIEYCLGLIIENDNLIISISENDSNPSLIKVNMREINKLMM